MKKAIILTTIALAAGYLLHQAGGITYTKRTDPLGREYHQKSNFFTGKFHTIVDTSRKEFDAKNINWQELADKIKNYKPEEPKNTKSQFFGAPLTKTAADNSEESEELLSCRPGLDYFKWSANTAAKLSKPGQLATSEGHCFKDVSFSFEWDDETKKDSLTVTIKAQHKKSWFCHDWYAVSLGLNTDFSIQFLGGEYRKTFKNLTPELREAVDLVGVKIFRFCDSVFNFVPNLVKTGALFFGGFGLNPHIPIMGSRVPQIVQDLNVDFVKKATGYQWRKRPKQFFIDLDESYVQSGDFLGITRFDGIDNIIHWGSGSRTGHSVMALWDRTGPVPELYIVESQAALYWPKAGIQRTKFSEWKKLANNAGYNVVHLPLSKEYAAKFDEEKAWKWFRQTEGMPYGFRNFLFTFVDEDNHNIPAVSDLDFVYYAFKTLTTHLPQVQLQRLVQEALNWRLGTEGLDLQGIELEAARKGVSLKQLVNIPEKNKVKYSDGYSYVCSGYVTSMWLEAGVFGDLDILPSEFTPMNIYQLKIFEPNAEMSPECKLHNPGMPYCQIMGEFYTELDNFNTIDPYNHMDEHCATQAPFYRQAKGC